MFDIDCHSHPPPENAHDVGAGIHRNGPKMSDHHAPATAGEKPKFLKAKFQVGSIKGKSEYPRGERVFHPDDVPMRAKAAKKEVRFVYLANSQLPFPCLIAV